ncbi:rRNA maturation RNase YbeY [Calidithermus chliarophilus]|uniref:rRNA maturation RNase YbeY n=1 Tax=Calidithermus chliarophilus TaxID=52023 RepID=UPI00040B6A3A|nr:rRNA maturation RNase YbeY [Calidithermus chliarophilus]
MPQIDLIAQTKVPRGLRPRLRKALGRLMQELGYGEHALTVVLTDDAEIRALKKQHWGEDAPTDVLSFPTFEPGDPFVPPHLGDIIISLDTAARQAREQGHGLEDEVLILAAHSLWHLLGNDHTTETEWAGFHRVQAQILEL